MNAGITSYGVGLPRCRICVDDILQVWRNTHKQILSRMGFNERAVLYPDQDTITLAIDAGAQALQRSFVEPDAIGALILGTGTNPYNTKASATIIGEALGLPQDIISFDLQFSGKSGTSALITALALVESGQAEHAMAIGADTINRHIPPGHWLEYGASAGAVAFIIGKERIIAQVIGHTSFAQDQNDYFRVEGDRFIQVGCGVTGYATGWGIKDNMLPAVRNLFTKLDLSAKEIDDCAIHQSTLMPPNTVAQAMELDLKESVQPNLLTPSVGDCGSASCLLALAHIFDKRQEKRNILVGSYGYGAGSDFLYLKTLPGIQRYENTGNTTQDLIDDKIMVDYGTAQKYEHKYLRGNQVTGNL
jgi:2-acetylphloroglucinol acetyltransferase